MYIIQEYKINHAQVTWFSFIQILKISKCQVKKKNQQRKTF